MDPTPDPGVIELCMSPPDGPWPDLCSHLVAACAEGVAPNRLAPGVGVSELKRKGVGCAHLPGVGVSPTPIGP